MKDRKNVLKYRKRRSINIGIVVFLIMFVYILINIYIYFTKDKLSIYEVHKGTTAIDNQITGVILRSEKLVYSQKAGYITYYQKEGARVAKDMPVYSVDDSGQLYSIVADNDVQVTLSQKNNDKFKHDIREFENNFSDNNFSGVYNFKENAQSTVLDILNDTVITRGLELMENTGITYSYTMIPSMESGVISYYMDNYEDSKPEAVTEDWFQQDKYKRTSLRSTQMVPKESPIYKLITSETWSLILPLTKEQYDLLSGKEKISFKVLNDDLEMTGALKLLTPKKDNYYAQLTMNKYLSNYLEERYLDVELDFDSVDGLKIPTSAVIEKDFYLVPLEYFAQGSESKELGLTKITHTKSGDVTYTHVPTDIYYQDDTVAYVDTDLFEPGTQLQSPVNSDVYTLAETGKLTGVYNVNQGYSVFRRIEVLFQNDEYCIIAENTSNGVSVYDHIALDGSTAVDQGIIY